MGMGKLDNHQCEFYFICKDSDCVKKGAKDIYKTLKQTLKEENLFKSSRIVKTRCMGGCKNAPVAFIGQEWHTKVKEKQVKEYILKLKKTRTE